MPTRDEMTIDERRKYVTLMAERYWKAKRKERSQLLSEMEQVSKLHRKHLIRLLNGKSLERKKRSTPSEPYVWAGSRTRSLAGVGEPGLPLCGATDPQFGEDGQAFGRLWFTGLDDRGGEPKGDDQPRNGGAYVAQEPRAQSPFAAHRPPPSQSGDQRGADGTHSLGHERARSLRDGFSASWGRECGRGVWAHPATDRCSHRLE